MSTMLIIWVCMLVAGAVGWGVGRAGALSHSSSALPVSSNAEREAWKAGYTAARDECLRIAKAHDFHQIDLQLSRMEPKNV